MDGLFPSAIRTYLKEKPLHEAYLASCNGFLYVLKESLSRMAVCATLSAAPIATASKAAVALSRNEIAMDHDCTHRSSPVSSMVDSFAHIAFNCFLSAGKSSTTD